MKDTELTGTGSAIDIWTTPLYINKGDQISISIKGTFTGNIKIRRWLTAYGVDLPDDPVLSLRHIGVSNIFTEDSPHATTEDSSHASTEDLPDVII